MNSTLSNDTLFAALRAWPLSEPLTVKRLSGGFTSEVWDVQDGKDHFVAKYAYQPEADFVGVIDWGTIAHGPLLFDVALAILWLFPEGSQAHQKFLQAYLSEAPISINELEGLPYYKALLWARQAKYFAYRVAANVTLGATNPEENAKSLAESRQQLEHLLAPCK